MNPRSDRLFWMAFAVCFVAYLIPLWSGKYLPMVDLPHHATQVSILRHFNDASYGFKGVYWINWLTPYALAYHVAWFFSLFLPVIDAVKVVVTLSCLGFPVALLFVVRQLGGDPWWSLLGFPGAFGLSFLWGLFNYCFAVPLAVVCVGLAVRYAYVPSGKNAVALALMSLVVFFSHGVAFGACTLFNTWIVLSFSSKSLGWPRRLWPVVAPMILAPIWYLDSSKGVPSVDAKVQWDFNGIERLLEIAKIIFSAGGDRRSEMIAYAMFAAVALGGNPAWQWKRAVMPVIGIGLFLVAPFHFLGHSFIYSRLAMFALLGFLMAFKMARSPWRVWPARVVILALSLFWCHELAFRFRGFNREAQEFDQVIKQALPNRRLLALTFNRQSKYVGAEPFYHFAGWYQTEKGGQLAYGFGYLYNMVARYRPSKEVLPFHQACAIWDNPSNMNWKDYGHFDYYLARTVTEFPMELFKDSGGKAVLVAREGAWWLFKNKERLP